MKNKDIFKLTLTKKIFLMILVAFIAVEFIHAQVMISNNIMNAYSKLFEEQPTKDINNLAGLFYDKYRSIDDSDFLKKIKETNNRHIFLMNEEQNIVDEVTYRNEEFLKTELTFANASFDNDGNVNNTDSYTYVVNLKKYSEKQRGSIEFTIYSLFEEIQSPIQCEVSFESGENTDNGYYSEKINYLSVYGVELINGSGEKDIQTLSLEEYISPRFRIHYRNIGLGQWYLDDRKILDIAKSHLTILEFQSMNFPVVFNETNQVNQVNNILESRFKEEYLYIATMVPLVSKEDIQDNGEFNKEDVKGYLIYYGVDVNSYSQIINTVIDDNFRVYVLDILFSIAISLIISFMLTKRVKKISAVTERIANNDFDMKLKERPYDELGILSKNINSMSEQLNNTINKLNGEIENVKKLESVRKEFIANFTHEIKTPLGIIDGYIELIEDCKSEEKKQKYFEEINKETQRINGLVLAMLNLSRLESGKVELHIQDIDIEDMITSIIDSFTSLLEKKDIKVKLTGENVVIHADPFELEMVIKNFMSNAIKHTPQGCCIEIIYNENEMSIENEGSSISEQQLERIWDTYVSSDREGTGLGLAICKSILDLHGFKYKVENTDKGVRFTFTIKAPIN